MKRILAPLLSALLLAGVAVGIYLSASEQFALGERVALRGLSGSEKLPFLSDARVRERLRDLGLELSVEKAGSREIATRYDLDGYDFAWPAGVPAAEHIRRRRADTHLYTPFYTPMAIASWQPVFEVLSANGLASEQAGVRYLDFRRLMALVNEGRRWNELARNDAYDVGKSVLVSSTDVRKSNSAAMYLSLASYVLNSENVVQNDADIDRVWPAIRDIFLRQGFTEYSSAAPFEDYRVMGMGKAPLVMIYEAQFVHGLAAGDGLRDDMVLLYPRPTVFSKHVFVALTENGRRLGQALDSDPELQALASEYGFRTNDIEAFLARARSLGVTLPDVLVEVVEPPSYELLERMIERIATAYN